MFFRGPQGMELSLRFIVLTMSPYLRFTFFNYILRGLGSPEGSCQFCPPPLGVIPDVYTSRTSPHVQCTCDQTQLSRPSEFLPKSPVLCSVIFNMAVGWQLVPFWSPVKMVDACCSFGSILTIVRSSSPSSISLSFRLS